MIICFILLESVKLKEEVIPALLRKHHDWSYTHTFQSIFSDSFWMKIIEFVNRNIVKYISSKKNPIKNVTKNELLNFYGIH